MTRDSFRQAPTDPGSAPSLAQGGEGARNTGVEGDDPALQAERQRLRILSVVIGAILLALLWDVWAGPRSAFRYGDLRAQAAEARQELADLERKTSRAVFALRALQQDPKAYERLLADELRVVPEGARVIEFDDEASEDEATP